ncbi:hypothetical protein [Bifidobacterium moukalabense]|uniref:Uncharacterized protein n=1 Tax=Bifidobacterium moukalabense DSM 27321 TaxID=1435051 RepID=W4NA91_9BIFI|nr:hypothetical protein [Bifidobacterium moukalabense]ETY71381.1 hypothetical protein BMOU_0870 [Bifidobacterium moukalabense DSM 27321]
MRRKELEKRLNRLAKEHNATAIWSEGGNHSKVAIQGVETTVPATARSTSSPPGASSATSKGI